jgi:hypothetical protein
MDESPKNPYPIDFGGVRKVKEQAPVLGDDGLPTKGDDGKPELEDTGRYVLAGEFTCKVGEKPFRTTMYVTEDDLRERLGLTMADVDMRPKAEPPEALVNLIFQRAEEAQEKLLYDIRRWEHGVAQSVIEKAQGDAE